MNTYNGLLSYIWSYLIYIIYTCLPSFPTTSRWTLQLCSLICEDREGRQALKKEHWDISIYSKLAREVGSQFDFEPRSTSKEVKGVRRGSKRNSSGRKKEKSSSESKSPVSLAVILAQRVIVAIAE